jgi:hypothetical protein
VNKLIRLNSSSGPCASSILLVVAVFSSGMLQSRLDISDTNSVLSVSKQHWPTVTCFPDALPVAIFCQRIIWQFFPPLVYWNVFLPLQACDSALPLLPFKWRADNSIISFHRRQDMGSWDATLLVVVAAAAGAHCFCSKTWNERDKLGNLWVGGRIHWKLSERNGV